MSKQRLIDGNELYRGGESFLDTEIQALFLFLRDVGSD